MRKMVEKIIEIAGDIKTGVEVYLLARRISRRNREITTQSLRDIYGEI